MDDYLCGSRVRGGRSGVRPRVGAEGTVDDYLCGSRVRGGRSGVRPRVGAEGTVDDYLCGSRVIEEGEIGCETPCGSGGHSG